MGEFLKGKIVYLDEQAVCDFLELNNGGIQQQIIKDISEKIIKTEAGGVLEAGTGLSILGKAKVWLSGNASFQKSGMIESQVTSTILSEFKKAVSENKNNKDFYIEEFDGARISIEIDSPAYYRSLTSVLGMVNNIQEINNLSDEEKAKFNGYEIKNIEKTLDKMSGYYALKCRKKNEEEIIVRFNINGMRNNYKLSDLTTMSVKLYGIKVGETEGMDIKLDSYLNKLSSQNESKVGVEYKSTEEIFKIPVYDILVAGV